MSMVRISFVGNLGKDPALRYLPNGKAVCELSVGVGRSKRDASGGWADDGTDWFRVSVWEDKAERAAESLRKGARVFVEGRFRTREYLGKDGSPRVSLEVAADAVHELARGERQERPAQAVERVEAGAKDEELDALPW